MKFFYAVYPHENASDARAKNRIVNYHVFRTKHLILNYCARQLNFGTRKVK